MPTRPLDRRSLGSSPNVLAAPIGRTECPGEDILSASGVGDNRRDAKELYLQLWSINSIRPLIRGQVSSRLDSAYLLQP